MAFRKPGTAAKPRQYPTLSRLILDTLAEFGETTLDSFFPAKYPEARLWRSILGLENKYQFRKRTFSSLLSRLRVQGLIARKPLGRQSIWRLTPKGKNCIAPKTNPQSDGMQRLVIFDIPEKERAKRQAIRTELIAAGFQQLQKSVWYGKHPLPEDFLELIDALQLKQCVHIFSVKNYGTLSQ